VKAPKASIRDSGTFHALLQLSALPDLQGRCKVGASWEGFVIEQIIGALQIRDAYFWATHAGAELDLLVWFGASGTDSRVNTQTLRSRLAPYRSE